MMDLIHAMLNRKDGERQKGFTLIELLVVVVIIGILAAIAVPIFLNQRIAAWNSTVQSDVKNASTVVETASTSDNGALPTTPTASFNSTTAIGGENVTVSNGNTLVYAPSGNTYLIAGWNTNSGTKVYVYDSASGKMYSATKSGTTTTVTVGTTPYYVTTTDGTGGSISATAPTA